MDVTDEIMKSYYKKLEKLVSFKQTNMHQNVKFCYTPMHGVGTPFAKKVFETFGLPPFIEVTEQKDPDPDFPTVSFPNPEEKGAFNYSIKTANLNNCSVIFANDPDADRLSVAEKQHDGKWRQFNGNEIGVILASFIIQKVKMENGGKIKVKS
jgi:phosphomannomutase